MKTVYSYQEIGSEIDVGHAVRFTAHPTARVSVKRKDDSLQVTVILSIGDTCVGIIETDYSSEADLLDAFQIDDLDEIWEILVQ